MPYDLLSFSIGHSYYGSKVYDEHDKMCLVILLKKCFNE